MLMKSKNEIKRKLNPFSFTRVLEVTLKHKTINLN